MARVSSWDVKAIIDTRREDVDVFIDTAHALVNNCLGDEGLSEELLAQIELWVAAHFVAIADPRITQKDVDGLRIAVERAELGKGLDATRYGQQAKMLDPTGKLSQLSNPQRRRFLFRAGSPPSSAW